MKKTISLAICLMIFCQSALAGDKEVLHQAYTLVADNYIDKINLSSLFAPSFSSLKKIDRKLNVMLEKNAITVYYNGKIVKVYSRPQDERNAKEWANHSAYLLEELKKISPKLKHKDFELVEFMLYHGMQGMDKNSHYYPTLEMGQKTEKIQGYKSSLLDGDILYIRLGTINDYTLEQFQQTLQQQTSVKGVVLDLRGNKGGYLKQALEVADSFLNDRYVMFTVGKDKCKRRRYRMSDGVDIDLVPMVVLVDGKTASSAEVIALILKEQGRAKIVGAQTYGKNSVQNIYAMDNGGYLALTSERFYSPRGIPVEDVGLRPNICSEVFDTDSNIDELLDYPYNFACQKLSRNSPFDLDVALRVLSREIANKKQ